MGGGEVVEDDEDDAEVDHVDEHCAVGFEDFEGARLVVE